MHKDGLEKTAVPVLPTLDLLDNVTPALIDGLDHSVTYAPRHGLDQNVMPVKGLDSVKRVTALNVSKMDIGKDHFRTMSRK